MLFSQEITYLKPETSSTVADSNIKIKQVRDDSHTTVTDITSVSDITTFLDVTTVSEKTFDPVSTKNCDKILEVGQWANFKKTGAWKRYNMDSNNLLLVDEEEPRQFRLDAVFYDGKIEKNVKIKQEIQGSYSEKNLEMNDSKCNHPYLYYDCTDKPNWANGFYEWKRQSYSGNWVTTEKECQLQKLSKNDITKCFNSKNQPHNNPTVIGISGDSVSRQIFLAVGMYLKNQTTGFYDNGNQHGYFQAKVNKNLSVVFYWDGATSESQKLMKKITKNQTTKTIFDVENVNLLIVGPKCLHPMDKYMGTMPHVKQDKTVHPEDYFLQIELPRIKAFLRKNEFGFVYVIAQHYVHRNRGGEESRTYRSHDIIKRYNAKIRHYVKGQKNERLKYVGVSEKLSFTPEGDTVLTPDGTHWMWKMDKKTGRQPDLPIPPTLVGLLDVIFNHYCFYNKK